VKPLNRLLDREAYTVESLFAEPKTEQTVTNNIHYDNRHYDNRKYDIDISISFAGGGGLLGTLIGVGTIIWLLHKVSPFLFGPANFVSHWVG
jgi:hypothetical protein